MKIELKQMIIKYKKLKQILMEKRIGMALRFPFLCSLYCTYKDNDCVYLLMPFVNGGDMWTLLRKYEIKLIMVNTIYYNCHKLQQTKVYRRPGKVLCGSSGFGVGVFAAL